MQDQSHLTLEIIHLGHRLITDPDDAATAYLTASGS